MNWEWILSFQQFCGTTNLKGFFFHLFQWFFQIQTAESDMSAAGAENVCMLVVSWLLALTVRSCATSNRRSEATKTLCLWGWVGVSGPYSCWWPKCRSQHAVCATESGCGCVLWSALLSVHLSLCGLQPAPAFHSPSQSKGLLSSPGLDLICL